VGGDDDANVGLNRGSSPEEPLKRG